MQPNNTTCPICGSDNLTRFNSYKHHCFACGDCNTVFHKKKTGKYLLEYALPRTLCKKILPRQAFLRIFRDIGDFNPADFYDVYAKECTVESEFRRSEVNQLMDQFAVNGITFEGKSVLDISGGPGVVARHLREICDKVVVTEYSEIATRAMRETLGVETVQFDYAKDKLNEIFTEKFDIVLVRSSIIFCPDLDSFIASVGKILKPGGHILIETILPTLGEVFWWQQMEYKFPTIYAQETIEKYFYKNGFSLAYGYREYGSYIGIKQRCTKTISRKLFTWLIDYPMTLAYYALARKSRIPIDQKLHHKMLTQIWKKTEAAQNVQEKPYINYHAGESTKSTHFEYTYNGYLKR
ncbi:MAG: class I SAM-dependent methyltransferase [Betaproteobacteria bacterium]|nr:class I SAM-dependent methyltransferase [Betaproteobacteria bacterium]